MADLDNGVHELPFSEIKKLDGFKQCVEEYKLCCVNPDVKPKEQFEFYWYQELSDTLNCFAVIHNGKCVGFCSFFPNYDPHLNCKVAVIESVFIKAEFSGKYWNALLKQVRTQAKQLDCTGVLISASANTKFEKYLSLKFKRTNSVFWISLNKEVK